METTEAEAQVANDMEGPLWIQKSKDDKGMESKEKKNNKSMVGLHRNALMQREK